MFDLNFPFVLCFKQWQRKGSGSNLSTDFKWDNVHNTQVIHSFTICKLVNCLFIPQLIRSTYNLRIFSFHCEDTLKCHKDLEEASKFWVKGKYVFETSGLICCSQ